MRKNRAKRRRKKIAAAFFNVTKCLTRTAVTSVEIYISIQYIRLSIKEKKHIRNTHTHTNATDFDVVCYFCSFNLCSCRALSRRIIRLINICLFWFYCFLSNLLEVEETKIKTKSSSTLLWFELLFENVKIQLAESYKVDFSKKNAFTCLWAITHLHTLSSYICI